MLVVCCVCLFVLKLVRLYVCIYIYIHMCVYIQVCSMSYAMYAQMSIHIKYACAYACMYMCDIHIHLYDMLGCDARIERCMYVPMRAYMKSMYMYVYRKHVHGSVVERGREGGRDRETDRERQRETERERYIYI